MTALPAPQGPGGAAASARWNPSPRRALPRALQRVRRQRHDATSRQQARGAAPRPLDCTAAAAARRLQRCTAPASLPEDVADAAAVEGGTASVGASNRIRLSDAEGITAAAAASLMVEELEEAAADADAASGRAPAAPAAGSGPAASAAEAAAGGAGEEAGDDSTEGLLRSRELGEIVGFALPALGMVLADPLMSLIDTGTCCCWAAGSAARARTHVHAVC